jgi:2-amino-4-hydroxy-6-hydroxymethyldihydropteridine diphosphokinase
VPLHICGEIIIKLRAFESLWQPKLKKMKTAYIGIGSNLGEKLENCKQAINLMGQMPDSNVTAQANYYLSEPVGVTGQDWYLNTVISIATDLSPHDLLEKLLKIERSLGRVRLKKWEARIIDLDLLLFDLDIIKSERLSVPHPLMHQRRFVLKPMIDLSPELKHPILNKTMAELLDDLKQDTHKIYPLKASLC